MARLTALPEQAIIDKLKGVIDFYLWKGIPCARKWPYYRKREPTPLEKANQDAFAYCNAIAPFLPEYVKDQYKRMAQGTPLTWRDLWVRAYMQGIRY